MFYEQKFFLSLLLTLIIEIPLVLFLVKYLFKQKEIKIFKIVFAGFIASTLTLPYFWFILPIYISSRGLYIYLGETLIVFTEAIIYNQFLELKFSRAFTASLVANIISIIFGLIIL